MQPKGNPKTLVCFRLTRQYPIFSSLSDTNQVKNKTALDMRDFLTWVGGVNMKIPIIRKFKTDINLSLNPVRDCRQNIPKYIHSNIWSNF